jgi:lipid-A-disaccharide synthase
MQRRTQQRAFRDGRGRSRPATCWPACCWTAAASAGPASSPSASAARRCWRTASRAGGRRKSWRCAATSRCCGTTRDRRHPPPAEGAAAARAAGAVHRRRCARLQSRPRADLRSRGIKTVHFVCPSIWAWRPERIEKIRAPADHVLCIFPFEPALLASTAWRHLRGPSAGQRDPDEPDRAAARAALGLTRRRREVVACCPAAGAPRSALPGARFFAAAALMRSSARDAVRGCRWSCRACVPRSKARCRPAAWRAGVKLLDGQSHAALAACDATLIASGTATLEAALFKRPMVIAYNMNCAVVAPDAAQAAAALGGPAQHPVPRLRGARTAAGAATPEALARHLAWLDRPEDAGPATKIFTALHELLQRDTPTLAPMRSRKFLKAEQAPLSGGRPA